MILRRESRRLDRSEEHTSELQSRLHLVFRLLLEKNLGRSRLSAVCRRRRTPPRGRSSAGEEYCAASMLGVFRRGGIVSFFKSGAHPRFTPFFQKPRSSA